MLVNKNEFFWEATIRLCGSLDIGKALKDCSDYIGAFVPLCQMYVLLFDPNMSIMRVVSSVIHEGDRGDKPIRIPEKYKLMWLHGWSGHIIINDHNSEQWFWEHARAMGAKNLNVSILLIRLKIRDSFACLALVADGQGVYTEEHAQLMLLLKEPLAVAMANALQYEEVLSLKNMLAAEQRSLYRKLMGLSDKFIGAQVGLKKVVEMCHQVARLDSPVLLLGETGTGKDLVANMIHDYSLRNESPFVSVNCGAMTETLLDSELFGHEKGAFTGAISQKMGRFERADKGTIYLDEIGELSPQGQVRLLRVIQYKEIERVGGIKPVPVDTRIIAATNRNLEEMVKSGSFRSDLWFRLNVFPIVLPPLRQRKTDIPDLVYYFIEQRKKDMKLNINPRLSPGSIDALMAYEWPGNVRELQNIVERALIRNNDGFLNFEELLTTQRQDGHQPIPPIDTPEESQNLNEVTSGLIRKVLKQTNGKINGPGGAAELLGIHPNTLRKKMDKLGIAYGRAQ